MVQIGNGLSLQFDAALEERLLQERHMPLIFPGGLHYDWILPLLSTKHKAPAELMLVHGAMFMGF